MTLPLQPTKDREFEIEKRVGIDRRHRKTPIFSKYTVKGRRIALRREEDRLRHFVPDRHNPKTMAVILVIIMLSVVDAILTLDLISRGAAEVNPIMAYYLGFGPLVFFWMKYLLTFASTMLILFHQEVYLFGTRVQAKVLYLLLILPFVLVVSWEIYLIQSLDK